MIKDRINGHIIERYSSIDDTPIARYMNFNRLVMLDSGIGSDIKAIDNHDRKIIMWANRGETEKIINATKNRNQAMNWAITNTHPGFMSYAVLVKSIDQNPVYDYTDDGCKYTVDKIASFGATKSFISRAVEAVKKNFEDEMNLSFPEKFNDAKVKEYFTKRKSRLKLILQKIAGMDVYDFEKRIKVAEEFMYAMMSPKVYSGKDGFEAKYISSYEEMCFMLSQHTSIDPESMTARRYFTSWKVLKKQLKEKTKAARKRGR